jgi:hypothetical protein
MVILWHWSERQSIVRSISHCAVFSRSNTRSEVAQPLG